MWFSVWQVAVPCQLIACQRQFPGTNKFNSTKIFTFAFNLVINIITLTDVLELKVNLEKYIFYMHCSVHEYLQIFANT